MRQSDMWSDTELNQDSTPIIQFGTISVAKRPIRARTGPKMSHHNQRLDALLVITISRWYAVPLTISDSNYRRARLVHTMSASRHHCDHAPTTRPEREGFP